MNPHIYSAFSNPVRVKLMLCLSDGPKNVTQLIDTCGLAQSAVSQHLAKLKRSGLVTATKHGHHIVYSLKYSQAATIGRLLQTLVQEVI